MTGLCVGMMDLGIRKFVHVLLDTGIRQYDRCGYWIPASASMTELGMTDLGIRNFVHVSLDTGIRQYDGSGYDEK